MYIHTVQAGQDYVESIIACDICTVIQYKAGQDNVESIIACDICTVIHYMQDKIM